MLQSAKIKIRSLKELQADNLENTNTGVNTTTPFKKRKKPTAAHSTAKKQRDDNENLLVKKAPPRTATKLHKSSYKEQPSSQKRIDSFFKTCEKTYKIEPFPEEPPPTPIGKINTKQQQKATSKTKKKSTTTKKATGSTQKRHKAGRKRLFVEPEFTTETETTCSHDCKNESIKTKMIECITIDSDSEDETNTPATKREVQPKADLNVTPILNPLTAAQLNEEFTTPEKAANDSCSSTNKSKSLTRNKSSSSNSIKQEKITPRCTTKTTKPQSITPDSLKQEKTTPRCTSTTTKPQSINQNKSSSSSSSLKQEKTTLRCSSATKPQSITQNKSSSSCSSLKQEKTTPHHRSVSSNENSSTAKSSKSHVNKENANNNTTPPNSSGSGCATKKTPSLSPSLPSTSTKTATKRKSKPCPPYKVIEGTTFAVDAFQYGAIENVSHYFLTHFHADHYIGLTRSFSMPLYMSQITARLVRTFIPIDEQHINELELNTPITIDNIEITALDANHCPGAVLLVFKFETGKCILHTGDFRAWHGMESEPIFWNNDIHTIYLDTTYITVKYDFCQQHESIEKAKSLIETFQEKHQGKRILYVCGSYVIGKEKFWSSLAEEYKWKVWTESNRYKALKAMEDKHLDGLLIEDAYQAELHVIPMPKLSYLHLVDYFSQYEQQYDIVFAIRPSGWEKNSKPQYRGKINIIGIEYSEHSSYTEMQRFVKFLKPQHVLSTVPTGRDLMVTAKIPQTWYKYDTLKSSSNYQPSIDTYFAQTPLRKPTRPRGNLNMAGLESFVSPLSLANKGKQRQSNRTPDDMPEVLSIHSSNNEVEQDRIRIETKQEPEISSRNLRKHKAKEPTNIEQDVNANILQQENLELGNSKEESAKPKKVVAKNKKNKTPLGKSLKNSASQANIVKQENGVALKMPTALVSQGSSEDFEKPDILSTVKKKPNNTNTKSNLKTSRENDRVIGTNIKKKLLFEEPNTKLKEIPKNSSTSKDVRPELVEQRTTIITTSDEDFENPQPQNTKLKEIPKISSTAKDVKPALVEQRTTIITTSDEDFENPQPQTSKRTILRLSKQNHNLPSVERERQGLHLTSSDNNTEIPPAQKPQRISTNKKQNSATTSSGEEINIRVSQRVRKKNQNLAKSPEESNDKEFEETLMKLSKHPEMSINLITNGTSTSVKQTPINPILKSNTTSNCSSATEEIPQTQIKQQTPRLLRHKRNGSTRTSAHTATPIKKSKNGTRSGKEQTAVPLVPISELDIPSDSSHSPEDTKSSQTAVKKILQNNNNIDIYNSSQMASLVEESLRTRCHGNSTDDMPHELQISSDGSLCADEIHAKPILNTATNCSFSSNETLCPDVTTAPQPSLNTKSKCPSSDDEIPTSQNKSQTPRFLSKKRNGLTQTFHKPTPIKKRKDQSSSSEEELPSTSDNSKTLLNKILRKNTAIDMYNSSQMATLVEESLRKQCLDTSTDHIPQELLSDADDDWMY